MLYTQLCNYVNGLFINHSSVLNQLAEEAGFPPGVFNVITFGEGSTPRNVELLLSNPLVRKLSFTGSTAIGKVSFYIYRLRFKSLIFNGRPVGKILLRSKYL